MTRENIKMQLIKNGYSIATWAKEHGHKAGTAQAVIKRWAGKRGIPKGQETYRILDDLHKTLGQPIYSFSFTTTEEDV